MNVSDGDDTPVVIRLWDGNINKLIVPMEACVTYGWENG